MTKVMTKNVAGWWYPQEPGFPQSFETDVLEKQVKQRFLDWLEQYRPEVHQYATPPRKYKPGVPDLLTTANGLSIHVEFKAWAKKPTPAQYIWARQQQSAGGVYFWGDNIGTLIDEWVWVEQYIATEAYRDPVLGQHKINVPGVGRTSINGEVYV